MTSQGLLSATAFVATSRPERYIKQLVSHFGNKVKTDLTDEGGRLEFDFGVCELKAAPTGIELMRGRSVRRVRVVPDEPNREPLTLYVARSTDDGVSFAPFVAAVKGVGMLPHRRPSHTTFRDGITESFAASPTYPGHLYITYEDWDSTNHQMDVKFTQSTDFGLTWSTPTIVNDNSDTAGPTDQFQPSVAAGPDGAVAVAFYDRRSACQSEPSVLDADVGRTNFCIDTSLQA